MLISISARRGCLLGGEWFFRGGRIAKSWPLNTLAYPRIQLEFFIIILLETEKMAWRNQGITGSNNIPLGARRRFGADGEGDGDSTPDRDLKRGRDPEPRPSEPSGPRQRKKRNRWGDGSENKAAGLINLPTAITSAMTSEQLEAYTLHLRIEEISQKLRIDDVVPADGDRYAYSRPVSTIP